MEKITDSVEVHVGENGQQFKGKYSTLVTATEQLAGLIFFKIDWTSKKKGKIRIEHGNNSIEVCDALGFVGTEDVEFKNLGMSEINIVSGITGPTGISHQQAREKFLGILRRIKQSGWQSTIPFSAPRLKGKEMLEYLFNSKRRTTLDANYSPTLDEWMQLDNFATWEFYSNHVFLRINFTRDQSKLNINQPGVYLINYELKTDLEYFMEFIDSDDRNRWREALPPEIKIASARRAMLEADLVKQGKKIDTNYSDPPLPK